MYKYQQEIIDKYQAAVKSFESWQEDGIDATNIIVLVFERSLSQYAKKKFREDNYFIDKSGLHIPNPNPIEVLPVIDMACAKSNTTKMGCYFVGMVGMNPITQENYYLVKVGFATDISRRIKQYANTNPMLYHNNCVLCIDGMDEAGYRDGEHNSHLYLARHAIGRAQNSNEWFYVSKETYLQMCEQFSNEEFFIKVACGEEE